MRYLVLIFASMTAFAAPAKKAAKPQTSNKNMSFDSQVVEGEIYRPDYSVVTGENPGEGWGVLRLRPNFADHTATDTAEESKR